MRRMLWEDFVDQPEGTVFLLYDPDKECPYPAEPQLAIKGERLPETDDFYMLPLGSWVGEAPKEATEDGIDTYQFTDVVMTDPGAWEREGTLRYDDIHYYVLTEDDILTIVNRLLAFPGSNAKQGRISKTEVSSPATHAGD